MSILRGSLRVAFWLAAFGFAYVSFEWLCGFFCLFVSLFICGLFGVNITLQVRLFNVYMLHIAWA